MQQIPIVTNIWTHNQHRTTYCLRVNDFEVQYLNEDNPQHSMKALKDKYGSTVHKKGTNFFRLNLMWIFTEGWVDITITYSIKKRLGIRNHKCQTKQQLAKNIISFEILELIT